LPVFLLRSKIHIRPKFPEFDPRAVVYSSTCLVVGGWHFGLTKTLPFAWFSQHWGAVRVHRHGHGQCFCQAQSNANFLKYDPHAVVCSNTCLIVGGGISALTKALATVRPYGLGEGILPAVIHAWHACCIGTAAVVLSSQGTPPHPAARK
jgi:hypothetical protein